MKKMTLDEFKLLVISPNWHRDQDTGIHCRKKSIIPVKNFKINDDNTISRKHIHELILVKAWLVRTSILDEIIIQQYMDCIYHDGVWNSLSFNVSSQKNSWTFRNIEVTDVHDNIMDVKELSRYLTNDFSPLYSTELIDHKLVFTNKTKTIN